MKRLEDEGSSVLINPKDREMIDMFQRANNPEIENHLELNNSEGSDLESLTIEVADPIEVNKERQRLSQKERIN